MNWYTWESQHGTYVCHTTVIAEIGRPTLEALVLRQSFMADPVGVWLEGFAAGEYKQSNRKLDFELSELSDVSLIWNTQGLLEIWLL